MPKLLKVPQLANQHRMPQMQVRRRRIEARLIRIGTPVSIDRCSRARSAVASVAPAAGIISAAPFEIKSNCSSTDANLTITFQV